MTRGRLSRFAGQVRASGLPEGGATAVEFAILFPIILLVSMVMVQAALLFHAQNVASTAAEEGLTQATAFDGSADAGRARAARYLSMLGGDRLVQGQEVTSERQAVEATVTVTGRSLSLVPGWEPRISQTATGPVERFPEADQ